MSSSDLALIRARRAEIARLRAAFDEEEQELSVTERTLVRLGAREVPGAAAFAKPVAATPKPTQVEMPKGNRGLIVETLKLEGTPWVPSAIELQSKIQNVFGVEIKTNSFHPILSDMKKAGIIVRDGPRIALASKVGSH